MDEGPVSSKIIQGHYLPKRLQKHGPSSRDFLEKNRGHVETHIRETITHWQNQIRLYERLCAPNELFSDGQKKTMLQKAVNTIDQLAVVKQSIEIERKKTGSDMTYEQYCSLLISVAVTYDQSYVQKNGDRRTAFLHEIKGPSYDDKGSGPITFHLGMDPICSSITILLYV